MFPLSPSSGVGTEWKHLFNFCKRDPTCKLKVPPRFTFYPPDVLKNIWAFVRRVRTAGSSSASKAASFTLNGIYTQGCAQNPWAVNCKECKQSTNKNRAPFLRAVMDMTVKAIFVFPRTSCNSFYQGKRTKLLGIASHALLTDSTGCNCKGLLQFGKITVSIPFPWKCFHCFRVIHMASCGLGAFFTFHKSHARFLTAYILFEINLSI